MKNNPLSCSIRKLQNIREWGELQWEDWAMTELTLDDIRATDPVSGIRVNNCVMKQYWKHANKAKEYKNVAYRAYSGIILSFIKVFCLAFTLHQGLQLWKLRIDLLLSGKGVDPVYSLRSVRRDNIRFLLSLLCRALAGSTLSTDYKHLLFETALPHYLIRPQRVHKSLTNVHSVFVHAK